MAAETQYTANTGIAQITAANTSLTGSGTLNTDIWTVITGGSNGTLIESITVKSAGTTTEGMVRLFVWDGANTQLLQEIHIPANTPSATNPAFEYTWNCSITLNSGYQVRATTQNANTFNIIAAGLDWTYFATAVRPESTNFTANTGMGVVSVANSNLDGTGTIVTILTARTGSGYKGCRIDSITVKAITTTTVGMIRLFIYNLTNTRLLAEIPIPAITQTATEEAFSHKISLGNFNLTAGWSIKATTQNAESFAITIEGNDWKYPSSNAITNYTPASGTAVITEELLHSLQVPANLVAAGGLLQVYANIATNNNANNKTFRIYVNTTNTLTSATRLATLITNNLTGDNISRYFPVISDTALECYGGSATSTESSYGTTTGVSANVTVPSVSAGFWVLISGQKAVAGDTDSIRWSMVQAVF